MNNEPVAWMVDDEVYLLNEIDGEELNAIPLYTHPVDAVNISEQYVDKTQNNRHDLTDEEIIQFIDDVVEVMDLSMAFTAVRKREWDAGINKFRELLEKATHPAELTDEEILQLWMQKNTLGGAQNIIEFSRAILRKAQE